MATPDNAFLAETLKNLNDSVKELASQSREQSSRIGELHRELGTINTQIKVLGEQTARLSGHDKEIDRIKYIIEGHHPDDGTGLMIQVAMLRQEVSTLKEQNTKWKGSLMIIAFVVPMIWTGILFLLNKAF